MTNEMGPERPRCPYCGTRASDTDVRNRRLEKLGYLHEDVRYDCPSCGGTWVHGVPRGESKSDKWECGSCGGPLIPHFLFVNLGSEEILCRPKCADCKHVPEDRITIESKFDGENVRGFVGHHVVTGDRTKAEGDPI